MFKYTIQLWTPNNIFIETLDTTKVMGALSFSRTIDNGYGDIKIQYKTERLSSPLKPYRMVKVYDGSNLVYRGYVSDIDETAGSNGEYVECKIIGLQALLQNSKYEDGVSGVVNKNDDPVNIINDILGQHNTNVGWTMFNTTGVPLYGSNIHMEFDNMDALSSIKEIAKVVGYVVDFMPDGSIRFFEPDTTTIDHPLVYGLNATEIKKKKKVTGMCNKITLKYNDGTSISSGDNTSSQTKYGIIWKVFEDDRIKNSTTADIRVQTELKKGAEPILQMQIRVDGYDGTFNIGGTIAIKNKLSETNGMTWQEAGDLGLTWEDFEPGGLYESTRQDLEPRYAYIVKIDTNDNYRVITLGDYDSLSKSLTKL